MNRPVSATANRKVGIWNTADKALRQHLWAQKLRVCFVEISICNLESNAKQYKCSYTSYISTYPVFMTTRCVYT